MKIGQDIIAKKAIWFAILANNESPFKTLWSQPPVQTETVHIPTLNNPRCRHD